MSTEGTLIGSARTTFRLLNATPSAMAVDHDKAKEIVAAGGKWLDVRFAERIPELPHRRRGQYSAVFHPAQAECTG